MAKKNKRSLEDGYDMYNPAPFVEHNPTFKYYADNINPIYVDNNTGEVWQNNKPKGSVSSKLLLFFFAIIKNQYLFYPHFLNYVYNYIL